MDESDSVGATKPKGTSTRDLDDTKHNSVVSVRFNESETVLNLPKESSTHTRMSRMADSRKKDLDEVSGLLEDATRRMEADLSNAKKELTASGLSNSLSPEEMQQQLLEVTKELEGMKYDGHLTSQIQNDLAAAKEEFERLSLHNNTKGGSNNSNSTTPKRGNKFGPNGTQGISKNSSTTNEIQTVQDSNLFTIPSFFASGESSQDGEGTKTELEAVKEELQRLRLENSSLLRKNEAQEKELAAAQQKLQGELGSADRTRRLDEEQCDPVGRKLWAVLVL